MPKRNYKQLGEPVFYPVFAKVCGLEPMAVVFPVMGVNRVVRFPEEILPETLKNLKLRDLFLVDIKVQNNGKGAIEFRNPRTEDGFVDSVKRGLEDYKAGRVTFHDTPPAKIEK